MAVSINGTVSSFEDNATTTSAVVSVPAGVVSGELLVASVAHTSQTAPSIPAGWTTIKAQAGFDTSSPSSMMCYRVATSSEPASYTFTVVSGRTTAYLMRVGGQDTTTPIDVAAVGSNVGVSTTYTTPTITTTTANAFLIYGIVLNAATASDIVVDAATTFVIGSTGTGRRSTIATEVKATAGVSTARTWTDTPSSSLQWDGIVAAIRASTVVPTVTVQKVTYSNRARFRASTW